MKPRLLVPVAVAIAMLVVASVALSKGDKLQGDHSGVVTVKVIEHAETDTVRHIGPANEKDSTGDVLAFANPLFNGANMKQVGRDNGYCIRTVVGQAWECAWTAILAKGQLMVQGPFYEGKDSLLAITGGTGKYRKARGEMKLHALNAQESEYSFTYKISQ